MNTFNGMKVVASNLVRPMPAIEMRDVRLKDGTQVFSDECRADMNAFLLERFGTRNVAYIIGGPSGHVILMNPRQVGLLKNYV